MSSTYVQASENLYSIHLLPLIPVGGNVIFVAK